VLVQDKNKVEQTKIQLLVLADLQIKSIKNKMKIGILIQHYRIRINN